MSQLGLKLNDLAAHTDNDLHTSQVDLQLGKPANPPKFGQIVLRQRPTHQTCSHTTADGSRFQASPPGGNVNGRGLLSLGHRPSAPFSGDTS
jgi:hypothetical protein